MVDLKRKYFRFLQSMATSDLVDVFVSDINLPHLPQILQTAIQVATDPTGMMGRPRRASENG
jgi:DNA-binding protein Fis